MGAPSISARGSIVLADAPSTAAPPRLLDRLRHALQELGRREVEAFLTSLAVDGRVSASTQNQALASILFLYRHVLEMEMPWLVEVVRAKRPFAGKLMRVREGKGDRDRVALLPNAVLDALHDQIARAKRMHVEDVSVGAGWVELPHAIARKYPNAGRDWPWQWVFPATRTYREAMTQQVRRHHLHETVIQRAVKDAVRAGAREPRRPDPELAG